MIHEAPKPPVYDPRGRSRFDPLPTDSTEKATAAVEAPMLLRNPEGNMTLTEFLQRLAVSLTGGAIVAFFTQIVTARWSWMIGLGLAALAAALSITLPNDALAATMAPWAITGSLAIGFMVFAAATAARGAWPMAIGGRVVNRWYWTDQRLIEAVSISVQVLDNYTIERFRLRTALSEVTLYANIQNALPFPIDIEAIDVQPRLPAFDRSLGRLHRGASGEIPARTDKALGFSDAVIASGGTAPLPGITHAVCGFELRIRTPWGSKLIQRSITLPAVVVS